MLLHAHRSTDTETLVIECYFDENDFNPIEDHIDTVQMIFFNGYNLLEPERSKEFPRLKIEFLFPKLFASESILFRDPAISQIFYNIETSPDLVKALLD